ncbi:MAG TPA: hypothetical protein VMV05_09425 [bacterium]|nr:hypothetical protein [bacterium]
MRKLFVLAMAAFFLTAASGLVLADGTAPAGSKAPVKKSHKGKHHKKAPRAGAPSTAAPAPTPAGK